MKSPLFLLALSLAPFAFPTSKSENRIIAIINEKGSPAIFTRVVFTHKNAEEVFPRFLEFFLPEGYRYGLGIPSDGKAALLGFRPDSELYVIQPIHERTHYILFPELDSIPKIGEENEPAYLMSQHNQEGKCLLPFDRSDESMKLIKDLRLWASENGKTKRCFMNSY